MKNLVVRRAIMVFALCFAISGIALADSVNNTSGSRSAGKVGSSTLQGIGAGKSTGPADVNVNVPFPTAGDAYCSATNGCGNIPAGGQTAYQWTAGDFVQSSLFTGTGITSATDLTANWTFQDFLGGGNSELWYVYVNTTLVAQTTLPDCGYCGSYGTVSGTVNFSDIAPIGGGYWLTLVEQNTIPSGGGSVAWADGGITGLSGTTTPEPGTLMLFGTGLLSLGGVVRRRLKA